jgi:hypothetical protein
MQRERLQDWLRLETLAGPVLDESGVREADEVAEAALARLMKLLPAFGPSPTFAASVIARAAASVPHRAPLLGSWGARAATVWVAAQVAILVAITTAVVGGLATALGPVRLLGWVVSGSAMALDQLLEALRLVVEVAEIGQSSLVSVGPTLVVSLLVCLVASALGVALLAPLYSPAGGARGALR